MHLDSAPSRNLLKRGRLQRGEGKFKTIGFIAVLLILVYVGFKLVPPYVSEYQLTDKMQEQARFGVVNRYSEEQVRDAIFKEVQDLEIPAKREDIKVTVTQSVVKVSLEYSVPVDLLLFSTELHFSPSSENKALF